MFPSCKVAFILCLTGTSAFAADCNFDKPVGSCTSRIEFKNAKGSNRSYSANIVVRSSSPTCSKVEYYVDHTPYTTVLSASNDEPESLSSSHPINRDSIGIRRCTAYEDRDGGAKADNKGMENGSGFSGTWSGSLRWTFVSDTARIDIKSNGSSASGTWYDGKSGDSLAFNGSVNGRTMTFSYVAPGDGSHGTATMTLTGSNTATFSSSAIGITFSGTLTRSN